MRKLWWDWRDLSLSLQTKEADNCYNQLFALRCWCGRWFGCSDHWFCGTCDDCKEFGS